jgi:hypothetical protein
VERQLRCSASRHRPRCRWHRHRLEAHVTLVAYTKTVDTWKNPNEDERGVDVGQIRAQLNLTVAERVRQMVHAANLFMTVQENARRFREAQTQ